MSFFAERLKTLRSQSGMTMQALADAANVSKSMICKIERDEVQPTIDVAARLAKAFGKTLSEMLHAAQSTQVLYLPKAEQAVWEDAQQIKRRNISPVIEGLKTEWLHVELPPGLSFKCVPANTHRGEKMILVIKGVLELRINTQEFRLNVGDSIYFDATCPHELINSGKEPLEYYILIKTE